MAHSCDNPDTCTLNTPENPFWCMIINDKSEGTDDEED